MIIPKKVAFILPSFMHEILEMDTKYFGIERGKLLNRLVDYYSSKKIKNIDLMKENNKKVQFNLNNKNTEMYFKILQENKFDSESEYMRSLVYEYISKPRYKREEIIFYETINNIKQAKIQNKKLNIKYNKEVRTVSPYEFKYSKEENRLYLFCYCHKNEDYRSYIVSKIESSMISSDTLEMKDEKLIAEMIKNFDPFRSYGKEVKVKLSKKGEEILGKAILNRPKYTNSKDGIYTFECDNRLAQIYFSQFYDEAEILEPKELRLWFKEKYSKLVKIYDIGRF